MRADNGAACQASDECLTNNCVDGVCCNAPCAGQCEACDLVLGTCTPVTGAPHGQRAACAAGDENNPCAKASCDGSEPASCKAFADSKVTCGTASCAAGKATISGVCDSKGTCKVPDPVPCGAYACDATACKTRCAIDADCAPGNTCDSATNKCVSGATCDGDHTTTSANGTTTNCTPYKCQSDGTCRTACGSVQDCATPFVCSPDHVCVALAADSEASGCNVAPAIGSPRGAGSPERTAMLAFGAFVALGAYGRRRRALRL
jgi:hypothetical protein